MPGNGDQRSASQQEECLPLPDPRGRLDELIRTLSDDQVKTVLRFAEALSRGRAVVSVCEVTEAGVPDPPDEPTPHPVSR